MSVRFIRAFWLPWNMNKISFLHHLILSHPRYLNCIVVVAVSIISIWLKLMLLIKFIMLMSNLVLLMFLCIVHLLSLWSLHFNFVCDWTLLMIWGCTALTIELQTAPGMILLCSCLLCIHRVCIYFTQLYGCVVYISHWYILILLLNKLMDVSFILFINFF